ncbi:MAG: hypothetical protein ACRD3I_10200, partial [Terriglobales bacterium]
FLIVRRYLVLIIDVLERTLDPLGFILPAVFGGSFGKWLAFLSALLGAVGLGEDGFLSERFSWLQLGEDLRRARGGEVNWLTHSGGLALARRDGLRQSAR